MAVATAEVRPQETLPARVSERLVARIALPVDGRHRLPSRLTPSR